MIANFALTSLVIRKDDRWNRNVLRILKQGEQYQFNGYGDECTACLMLHGAVGDDKTGGLAAVQKDVAAQILIGAQNLLKCPVVALRRNGVEHCLRVVEFLCHFAECRLVCRLEASNLQIVHRLFPPPPWLPPLELVWLLPPPPPPTPPPENPPPPDEKPPPEPDDLGIATI